MRIACLHAHYSNIEYIQTAIGSLHDCEVEHYVDPGLIRRMNRHAEFSLHQAQAKVHDQLNWMMQTQADALLLTCTQYIALLEQSEMVLPVPVLKIDEPLFEHICSATGPQLLVFTNPATVAGTMDRLHTYAKQRNACLTSLEPRIIPDSFDLLMSGRKREYIAVVTGYIKQLRKAEPGNRVIAAQLSMSGAAEAMEQETGQSLVTPATCLAHAVMALSLHVQNKNES